MKATSLRWRLRWLVVMALAAVLLPLGVLSFRATLHEIQELSDGRLAQSARTLLTLIERIGPEALGTAAATATGMPHVPITIPLGTRTYETEVAFQVTGPDGRVRLATANFAALAPPLASQRGFHEIRIGRYRWRTYTLSDPASGIVIRTGERYDSRRDILRALLLDHSLPLLFGLPLIALLVGWAVRRGLRPLDQLAQSLRARAPGSREPIRLHPMPLELQPVVTALNQQLERLEDALIRERRFSADVAHELRTPLTTALISVESAIAAGSPADAALPLAQAHQALEVLARRVGQLLALARLEAGAADSARTPVDLSALAVETIEELAQAIHDSGVEVSLHLPASPVQIDGFPAGLAALLRNLIENSLRHVDAGGHVAVSVGTRSDSATIDVSDDGPGIPMARRAEVFTRFHRESSARGDGYGLGLSIVQRAAELHAAKIELLDPPHGPGLRVRVTFSHPPTRMPEPDRR